MRLLANATILNHGCGLLPLLLLLLASSAFAQAPAASAEQPPQKIIYKGVEVWKLTDQRTEAIVVPAWGGRLIHYAKVGGANWLWSGQAEAEQEYFRWGGDKTFPGPHNMWAFTIGKMWPPPPMDTSAHEAEVKDGHLVTTSPAWPAYGGARVIREYSFSAKGELVIRHRITPVEGSGVPVCAWIITQTVPTYAYMKVVDDTIYKEPLVSLGGRPPSGLTRRLANDVMEIAPAPGVAYKVGTPARVQAIAARRGREVFLQTADFDKKAQYPEGVPGAGMTAEYYNHNAPGAGQYIELELLSPLRPLRDGVDFTTRWSIHMLEKDSSDGVETLLK